MDNRELAQELVKIAKGLVGARFDIDNDYQVEDLARQLNMSMTGLTYGFSAGREIGSVVRFVEAVRADRELAQDSEDTMFALYKLRNKRDDEIAKFERSGKLLKKYDRVKGGDYESGKEKIERYFNYEALKKYIIPLIKKFNAAGHSGIFQLS